ncbi:MAG: GLUG motif-containing protein [Clostridia bacterium]|jgi:hypothetical protein
MLTGENGILKRAKEAKEENERAQSEEKSILSNYEQEMEDAVDNITQVNDAEPGKLEEINGELFINSIEDLVVFSYNTAKGNSYEGKNVKLGTNLDFESKKSYVNSERTDYDIYGYKGSLINALNTNGFDGISSFSGTFDGNTHYIKNLFIKNEVVKYSYFGLFKANSGIIKNLELKNCSIKVSGTSNYGFFGGICGSNSGKIYNCKVSGTIESTYPNSILGGIAGYSGNEIKNCINYAKITGKSTQCGGIVGQHSGGTISQCGNYGDINLGYTEYIGGVIGLSLMKNDERNQCK